MSGKEVFFSDEKGGKSGLPLQTEINTMALFMKSMLFYYQSLKVSIYASILNLIAFSKEVTLSLLFFFEQ
jgi:hypothetical protein